MIDGAAATNIPVDEGWQVFSTAVPGGQALGSHTVSIEDGQGTTRTTGTFTIAPTPIGTH